MKKSLLFVVDERMMGGVSILLSNILNNINISKYEIDVLVLHDHGDYLDDLPKNVNVFYGGSFFKAVDYTIKEVLQSKKISLLLSKIRLVFLMKTKLIGRRIIRERKKILKKKYDVEIAFKDGFAAIFTAYGDSIKKYHWLHADYSEFDSTSKYVPLFRDVFPKFDKIIGISEGVINEFKKKYPVDKTEVIYNIIEPNKIIKLGDEENVSFDKKKINLISVGRLHPVKGYDRLIEVVHRLDEEKKMNNVILRIVGDGPDYTLLQNKIKEYKLENKVFLMGRKRNPYPYIKASDCFIMCSRCEAFGLVILESMILKTPILSLNILSIDEIMEKDYGMVYENSLDGLYNGLLEVIQNPQKLLKYRKALMQYHYDIKKITKQIENLFDE